MPLHHTNTDNMEDLSEDDEAQKIFKHLEAMADYIKRETKADTVQIITTHCDNKKQESMYQSVGTGNFYARVGSCRTWLKEVEKDDR